MQIDFTPSNENAFGVALLAGRVVGTVQGSSGHITVRATCKAKGDGGRWMTVPFADATHVFFDVPSAEGEWADKIGTFYPPNTGEKWAGHYFEDRAQTDAKRLAAAKYLMRTITGEIEGAHILKSERCARCSKELTHPDSIFAMFGPECIKKVAAYMPNRSGTPEGAHESKTPGAVEPDAEPLPPVEEPDDRRDGESVEDFWRRYDGLPPIAEARAEAEAEKPRTFEPPKPDVARKRVEKVATPRATSDQIVAVLRKGDDPKKVLAELAAR